MQKLELNATSFKKICRCMQRDSYQTTDGKWWMISRFDWYSETTGQYYPVPLIGDEYLTCEASPEGSLDMRTYVFEPRIHKTDIIQKM